MKIALTIAGSDSGGGAGIQADLKTFHQFGVFGTSAIVALTAQNTVGVHDIHVVPTAFVVSQLAALASDLPPAALKTGMLATGAIVAAVATAIRQYAWTNVVVDPVMVATSGDRLLDDDAESRIIRDLLPLAAVVTPNLDEVQRLTGMRPLSAGEMSDAGAQLLDMGAQAALIKGGHLPGDIVIDVLVTPEGERHFTRHRIHGRAGHGTGCTLSAAIAAGLALGRPLDEAVETALAYVAAAITAGTDLGAGSAPLNHSVPVP